MAQRGSQRAPAQMRGSPSIITQGLGRVTPQSQQGMFSTHVAPAQIAPVGDSRKGPSPLLNNLLSSLGNLADAAVERSKQTAYLEGAAAAGVGVSEEELRANPLTRAWAVAGHRDTTGSLAIAEYETGIAAAMSSLRERGPEAVQEYLKQARNQIMPVIGAMSREGRENALASLLTIDRKAIATHNVEHSKFIVDQTMKAKSTRLTASLDSLNAVRGTPAYIPARDSLFTTAVTEIQFDPNLSAEDKSKLTMDFLSLAMREGHLGMYELYKTYPVLPDGRGGHLTMSQLLSFDDQIKLSKSYAESRKYHENAIGFGAWQTLTDMETALLTGEPVTSEEYESHLAFMVGERLMNNSTAHTHRMKYARLAQEASDLGELSSAYITGNPDSLIRLGETPKKAMEAAEKLWARNDPELDTSTVIGRHLAIGVNNGWAESFSRVGQLMQPAVSAMMSADFENISPEQNAVIQNVWQSYEQANAEGRGELRSALMGPLSDDQRVFLSNILHHMSQDGMPPQEAVMKAREVDKTLREMSPPLRREMARRQEEQDDEIISKVGDITASYNLWRRAITPWITPVSRWGSNDQVVYLESLDVKNEIGRELQGFNERGKFFPDAGYKRDAAVAEVIERTIPVRHDGLHVNFILPQYINMHEFFGVNSSYNPERIGEALGAMFHREDATPYFRVQDGQLKVEYYNERGDAMPILTEWRDPTDVGAQAILIREKNDPQAVHIYGAGKVVKGPDGAAVRFNGENTAGIDPRDAFYVRDTLVKVEKVRNAPYPDGVINGKQQYSVGVGINTGNPTFYPDVEPGGKIDNATITSTFMQASDYFMNEAQRRLNEAGLRVANQKELLALTTHLTYQMTPQKFAEQVPPLFEAIGKGDIEAAYAALLQTNAYRAAGPDRKRMYTEWVRKVLRQY